MALNVNCRRTKVKTYLHFCSLAIANMAVLSVLKFHIQEAKYNPC